MCRNIKRLYPLDPPVTEEELRSAALQYVRKISGMQKPSTVNEEVFTAAVEAVTTASQQLLSALNTNHKPITREELATRAKQRGEKRFQNLRSS